MKVALKYIVISLTALIIIVASSVSYIKLVLPDTGKAPDISVPLTADRIEQGKYLANNVAVCMDCHSTRDWSQFAGPLAKGNFGGGGEKFDRNMGFPGEVYAKNITPSALSDWTDGEIFRAITSGVSKDGTALFPVMPYHNYGIMDQEDILDIIAYIRSLEYVANEVPERDLDFPVNILINTMPSKANFGKRPFPDDKLNYGKYLVNIAGCVNCHSQMDKGSIIPGTEFGGGMEFKQKAGIVRSANITPHATTGIGSYTTATFIKRFKMYNDSTYQSAKLTAADLNTPMPWTMYASMQESDLEAIYIYLNSLQPINNEVVKFEKK